MFFRVMIPVGLVVGLLCGLINGIIVAKFNVPEFIGTLATMSIFRALTYIIAIRDANGVIMSQPMKHTQYAWLGGGIILDRYDDFEVPKGFRPFGNLPADMAKRWDNAAHQALHHQFIASAMIVKYAHEHAPQCLIGNMFNLHHLYPETPSPADAYRAHEETEFNLFFCDVMAGGAYPAWIKAYYKRHNINIEWYEGYEEILKDGAVDFISLRTPNSAGRSTRQPYAFRSTNCGIVSTNRSTSSKTVWVPLKHRTKKARSTMITALPICALTSKRSP